MTAQQGGELSVEVKELRGHPGAQETFARTVPVPTEFSTVLIGLPEGEDLELDLRLESVHEGVLVTGTAAARAAGQCARCLDELSYPLTVDVMQLFTYPERAEPGADEEDERFVSEDLAIELEPMLRDLMVSALPFQPVCREDCPGLCSQCGFRLEDDPQHAHEQIDPRWAALTGLAEDLEGSEDEDGPRG